MEIPKTQDEYIAYLKKKAKCLEMDYAKILESRAWLKAWLKYQAGLIRQKQLTEGE